jgi:hypothetical protein
MLTLAAKSNQKRLALGIVIHFPGVGKWHEKLQKIVSAAFIAPTNVCLG